MIMNKFRLLVVDDQDQELATCRDSVVRYNDEKQRDIDLVECRTVEEAFQRLDNSFDGAIIDLKLADQGDEGNQVIGRITESHFRIPVAIFTGTPDNADTDFIYIGIFKKGETQYTDLFDQFWEIHNTGLTRIMGGRGVIEKTLNRVFLENILPQKDNWVSYGLADAPKTEKALLRHTLNHLLQLLDEDEDICFPDEVYIYPPLSTAIKTGSVVKRKADNHYFVILSPACDLVIRANGVFKTDRVLLIEVEASQVIIDDALNGIVKTDKKEKRLKVVFGNNHTDYYHWLPRTNFFNGGFLNFRKITTLSKKELDDQYHPPEIQISPSFVKDITARFSTFYARQGQPEIDSDRLISDIIAPPQEPQ